MPIYEYECCMCHHRYEVLQKMSEEPLTECLNCKKLTLEKLISRPAGFDLKGDGWYVTDFKNKNTPASAAKADAVKSDSAPAGSAGSEAKPAEPAKSEAVPSAPLKESKKDS